ncbi:MAG: 6-bladed beta-propeller [Sedimentisphaerales bacterium]|nr:6-bladed beta-propeller [Sedimentisphaerales bacterium]
MKNRKLCLPLWGVVLSVVVLSGLLLFGGCQPAPKKVVGPVFFPEPPDKPRLQFLKAISASDDIVGKTKSSFESFIAGEAEKKDTIAKPYGMAFFRGKLYVCDVGKGMVEVFDLEKKTFGYLTEDRRLKNPVNIRIDADGNKYVTDTIGKSLFVFDQNDILTAMWGRETAMAPVDIAIRGERCYVTDFNSNQILVLNKKTGEILDRFGKKGEGEGEIDMITNIALDQQDNMYITDMVKGQILKFDASGRFVRSFGQAGVNLEEFARPKGIDIDREGRIWVVDTASEVAKIIDPEGQLLLFFGLPGNAPGKMNLPAQILVDYDHVGYFSKYAVPGAKIEFLVLVSNQYGLNKINVYGFGSFPDRPVVSSPAPKPAPEAKSAIPQISDPNSK